MNGIKPGTSYSPVLRSFALTMHFYSPSAYRFLREKFKNHLPHPSVIRKWYANSNVNGAPGITEQAMQMVKRLGAEMKEKNQELVVALSFDEMAIRKNEQWDGKEFLGHVTVDDNKNSENEETPIANNSLVFMVTGVNKLFSLPVAYYFINSISTPLKHALVYEIIEQISKCDVRLISVTFDGLPQNIAVCEKFGASFNIEKDFRPYFEDPFQQKRVYVILDPPHMEKLARNTIASKKIIYVDNVAIKWDFFESLEVFRTEKNAAHMHKLNKKHIQWFRSKMNVRLAVETLSESVATCMEYFRDLGFNEFADCTETITFIRFCDKMFDTMNTKLISNNNNIFKSALNDANKNEIFAFYDEAIAYLKRLKLKSDGKPIYTGKNKTFVRGFIVNMTNIKMMYKDLVDTKIMNCLPVFRVSQDLLESLFGRIRQQNGCNDNPTCQQFMSAYRKLFINNSIRSSELANCIDDLNILTISSHRSRRPILNGSNTPTCDESLEESVCERSLEQICNLNPLVDGLEDVSIAYLAGFIEKKITNSRFECSDCLNVLKENEKILESQYMKSQHTQIPCRSTYTICKIANRNLNTYKRRSECNYDALFNFIMREINLSSLYINSNFVHDEMHKYYFVSFVVEEFLRLQSNQIARTTTLNLQTKIMRKGLHKYVHFLGQ